MSQLKYTGNKYVSYFDGKETTNLYDMAKDYKKKMDEFDKGITLNESILKKRQYPSQNVVKDVYSASSKVFSKKFLMYDTTIIKFSELQTIFGFKNDFMVFDNKRIIEFLNFIYTKLKLGIKANSDLQGKKVNLYFPLSTNTNWFIRKYISIESSSAPIEIVEVGDLVPNDLTNVSSYSVNLSTVQNNATTQLEVNGGKVNVRRMNDDVSTWIKSVYSKTSSSSESKKMGWGKTIVDLTLYNNFLIDVYKESVNKPSGDSNVEVSFPVYVCLEDMFTNTGLYEKYNVALLDNANFFNLAYLRLLKGINVPEESVLKRYIELYKEDKMTKKIVTGLSKTMSIYLGLKKTYIGILRKIRALFDGFSIKELNSLLNSINSFNNRRNYVKKKTSIANSDGSRTPTVSYQYFNLKTLEKFVDPKNLALVSKEIIGNDIKWGNDKIFNLNSVTDISNAIKALSTFYNENRYLDQLNYYSILSSEAIVADVAEDLKQSKSEKIEKNIADFNILTAKLADDFEINIKKIFNVEPNNLLKTVTKDYEKSITDFIKRLADLTQKFVDIYLTRVKDEKELNKKDIIEFINKNLSTIYFLEKNELIAYCVETFINNSNIGYTKNSDILNEVLLETSPLNPQMSEDVTSVLDKISTERYKIIEIRKTYNVSFASLIALLGNLESWTYGTNNLLTNKLELWTKSPVQNFKIIADYTKLPFKSELVSEFEEYEKKRSKVMDLQYANLIKFGELISTRLRKGLSNLIDIESLKQKKINEEDVNVKRDEQGISVNQIIVPQNVMEIDHENIKDNINEFQEEYNIIDNSQLEIHENKEGGNVIIKTDTESSTNVSSSTRGRSKIPNDKQKETKRNVSMVGTKRNKN